MLRLRIITAVVLLAILVAVLAAPGPVPFAIFLGIFMLGGLGEWWRLTLASAPVPASAVSAPDTPAPDISTLDGLARGPMAGFAHWFHTRLLMRETGFRLVWRLLCLVLAVLVGVSLLFDYTVLADAGVGLLSTPPESLRFGTPGWTFALEFLFARLWIWAAIGWIIVLVFLARARADAPPFGPLLTVFGALAIPAAGTALMAAQGRGTLYLLSLLAIIWVADSTAYFVGRAIGRRKLAPHISPGKTLEGALGGIAGAVLWVGLSSLYDAQGEAGYLTFGADLVARWSLPGALAIAAVLGMLSIAGDLFESLLKRRAGRKDSSQLLPGHGGIFDRIDAVLPVVPFALLLVAGQS